MNFDDSTGIFLIQNLIHSPYFTFMIYTKYLPITYDIIFTQLFLVIHDI